MARINGVDQDELEKIRKEKAIRQNQELKKLKSKPGASVQEEHEHKENVLDIYNNLSAEEKVIFHNELEKKKLRDSYINYLKYVYPDFKVTKFHALLANICQSVIEKIENHQTVRLCISVPPQHGKSTCITKTLPSWYVGRNPKRWAILSAYNADLAEEFSDNNRQLIKNHGKDIFGIETNTSQDNKTLFQVHKCGEKEIPSSDSGIMGVGILGGIVGHGGSLIVVDDPYKNSLDADNKSYRETVSNVFKSAILTRARGDGNAVIVIHTRWHDDDLIGELVKTGDWIYINIPAEWEKGEDRLLHRKIGETLCPELGFDSKWLEMTKKAMGKKLFNANYQGKPFIEGGNIVKREDLQFYNHSTQPASFEEIVLSCDLSFGGTKKGNDPYCMTLWGRNGGNHYLLKIYDKRANFTDTARTIRVICGEFPQLRKKIIEKRANGGATIELLSQEIGGFVPFDPKSTSKEDRLHAVSTYFEGHNVYFPSDEICKDIDDYVEQLLKFPSVEHDDFVDTISQYLLNYEYRYGGKIDTDGRFSMFAKAIRGF